VKFAGLSVAGSLAYLVVVGVVTAVIPTPLFERMTPVTTSNLVFWIMPALLVGPLISSYLLGRGTCGLPATPSGEDVLSGKSVAGGVLSFLAVGCPLCNKVVVLLLGASGALTCFEPLQPLLGVMSVALLAYALWLRFRPPAGWSPARWRQSRPPFGG
jgi:hypothetical protein